MQNPSKTLITSSVIHVYLIMFHLSSSLLPLPQSWHLMFCSNYEHAENAFILSLRKLQRYKSVPSTRGNKVSTISILFINWKMPASFICCRSRQKIQWCEHIRSQIVSLIQFLLCDLKSVLLSQTWKQRNATALKCNQNFSALSSSCTYLHF